MRKALVVFFFLVMAIQPAYAETCVGGISENGQHYEYCSNGSNVNVSQSHNSQPQPTQPPKIVTVVVTAAPTPTIIYKVIYRTVTASPTPTLTPTATPSATPTKAPTPTKTPSHRTTKQNSNVFQKIARFFQNILHFLHI